VALWTMVLADTGRAGLSPAIDFAGHRGKGSLGAWEAPAGGRESFVFSCPTLALSDFEGPDLALRDLSVTGADTLFLDRIRYPSPANGLELLGSCACPACRKRYTNETGVELPDLASIAARNARAGAEGAENFLREAAIPLEFRAHTVAAVASLYASAARSAGAGIGLDLFAPALSPLVGVDWGNLASRVDFIKGMFYCKSRGPACLPLEIECHVEGLVSSEVGRAEATSFAAALFCLPESEVVSASGPSMIPAGRAAMEYRRAASLIAKSSGSCELFAGIELVDYPGYGARVSPDDRDEYLGSLTACAPEGAPLALCWNLLYISDAHLRAVASCFAGKNGR
jgi:hypothetical protein